MGSAGADVIDEGVQPDTVAPLGSSIVHVEMSYGITFPERDIRVEYH